MYEGFLEFGDTEIINSARTVNYITASSCSVSWLKCPPCDGVGDALDEDYTDITQAPWYDVEDEASHRFLGVHGLLFEGLPGSTRTADVTEGLLDGGVVGQVRNATRRVRVEAMLSAQGEDALEAGLAWLDASLRPARCAQNHTHNEGCAPHADVRIFTACPPEYDGTTTTPDAYDAAVEKLTRYMHTVTAVAGPTVVQKFHRGDAWGYLVEFVLVAATPWLHGITRSIVTSPSIPVVIQDIPFNLVPYPSAELPAGTVVAATNLSTNPSAETAITGWAVTADGSKILAAQVGVSQSNELWSAGGFSAKALFTANTTNTAGYFGTNQTVQLTGITATTRYSVNLWASASIQSGTAVLGTVDVVAFWQNAGGTVLGSTIIGTQAAAGGALSLKSILPPAGTTKVVVEARVNVTSWNTGAIIRLYADALAVTVP